MTALGQTIKRLREERGWTQAELGKRVGLDGTNIARRERGQIRVKPVERPRFADAFGMSLIDFDDQWRNWQLERTRGAHGIPIINRAPAGMIVDYEEHGVDTGQGFEYVDFGDITDPLAFGVIVVGDSMESTLSDGDKVILSPIDPYRQSDLLANGKIVFVRFGVEFNDGGCTLARFYADEDGQIRLQKDNPDYRPILCGREDVQSVAVAIERRLKL